MLDHSSKVEHELSLNIETSNLSPTSPELSVLVALLKE